MYASSDVFLFPSPTETFGNVVLEALASGLPVIGANAGGVQHLLQDNQNGFLCEAKSVNDFVTKTIMLLSNDKLRQAFRKRAREFAIGQSWDRIFERLILSFEDILVLKNKYSA